MPAKTVESFSTPFPSGWSDAIVIDAVRPNADGTITVWGTIVVEGVHGQWSSNFGPVRLSGDGLARREARDLHDRHRTEPTP